MFLSSPRNLLTIHPPLAFSPFCVPTSPCATPDRADKHNTTDRPVRAAECRTTEDPSVPPRAAHPKTRLCRRVLHHRRPVAAIVPAVPAVISTSARHTLFGSLDRVPFPVDPGH